tara:strand:+ start:16297 stop:16497 length:201 start_codon:yes stop_codon:yes gene_type:complete
MPDFDIKYGTVPANTAVRPRGPSIANLKAALTTFNATSYSAARLNTMSKNDLISACITHGLTVAGL